MTQLQLRSMNVNDTFDAGAFPFTIWTILTGFIGQRYSQCIEEHRIMQTELSKNSGHGTIPLTTICARCAGAGPVPMPREEYEASGGPPNILRRQHPRISTLKNLVEL